jgi:hypothetical protein
MTVSEVDTPPRKPPAEVLKPVTDRLTREPAEHPTPVPKEPAPHPVTRARASRREPVGG